MSSSKLPSVDAAAFLATLAIYLEAFAERDPARRGDLLAHCFTADGEIWGPNRMFVGRAAISEKIAAFHVNWPGCRLVVASGIVTFDNAVRLGNALVGPDGSVRARGQTIFELAPDGRIRRVVPLWDAKLPGLPPSWPAHLAAPVERDPPDESGTSTEMFRSAVAPLLAEMEASANAHDTDRHMAAYAQDPSLVFVFDGEIVRGWDVLRLLQRKWWNDGKATGTYAYVGAPIVEALGDDAGLTTFLIAARKTNDDGSVAERTLAYSALWRRRAEGWRITFAHESSAR